MSDRYILEGHKVVPCENLMEWAKWYETANRHVAKTQISEDVTVSTVFLALNHSFSDGEPVLFETMVFGGEYDEEIERYSTWEQAEKGHQKWVDKIKSKGKVTK